MQIPCFSYFESLYLPKKLVTSTMSLTIERITYHDMFHKNLQVSHDQVLRYFFFNPLFSIICVNFSSFSNRELARWKLFFFLKKTFSLVSVGMVNHSFLIFFIRLTMFIVKLDQQLIRKINRLNFSFWKQNCIAPQWHKYACAQ